MRIVATTGFQQLTAANLAASFPLTPVKQAGTGQAPNAAYMTASATAVRYTDDGTTVPTAAIGMRLPVGVAPFLYQGNLANFRAILESGTPTLDVTYLLVSD
jgi:hypothetical protein